MDELAQVLSDNLLVIVAAVLAGVAVLAFHWVLARRGGPGSSDIEQRFRNVFSLMTDERRQALIQFYTQKHKCNRHEAMQIAMDARASDENRW